VLHNQYNPTSPSITIYTIGHSNRPLTKLIELLRQHNIQILADIRTVPISRQNPQFTQESLEREMPNLKIRYLHLPELGGFRKPTKDSVNKAWRNGSFRGYADYMMTGEFQTAIEKLIALAMSDCVAIMCAEGNPYQCHRSLVSDALVARGVIMLHITSRQPGKQHQLTPFARIEGTSITYPSLL
jgi:uncharacterized protein (DUF488 family)